MSYRDDLVPLLFRAVVEDEESDKEEKPFMARTFAAIRDTINIVRSIVYIPLYKAIHRDEGLRSGPCIWSRKHKRPLSPDHSINRPCISPTSSADDGPASLVRATIRPTPCRP